MISKDSPQYLERVQKYFEEQDHENAVRTDKAFRVLLAVEWVFGIVTAFFVSPKTWSGPMASVHLHLWTSVLLGGAIVSFPIILVFLRPGSVFSRHAIAASQMLYGGMLIHLMGGRIEAHFHVFGSLAFLAMYRRWQVLIPATVVVAADHILRGYFWPQSVYGVVAGADWRWLEHAAWVVFEDIFLIISIVQARRDMRKLAENRATLEFHNEAIEEQVKDRTEELRVEQAKTVHASKLSSLGEMAGGIAHEINNPLAIITGYAERIQRQIRQGKFDEKSASELCERIAKQSQRITRIVRGLKNFAREGSQDPFLPTPVHTIIEDSVELCQERFKSHGITLLIDGIPDGLTLECQSIALSQVLVNLLNNAHDAIEDSEEKWVSIKVHSNDTQLEMWVTDSGPGIPLDVQEKMLNPFFTTKGAGKGTGLGLSISQSILEKHHGKLEIDNECKNTRFVLRIPLVQPPGEKQSPSPLKSTAA